MTRTQKNRTRLAHLHPILARKVAAVIRDLEGQRERWEPVIASGYRTRAEQIALYRAGHSTVKYSFHNATRPGPDGRAIPCGLAADLVDDRWGWGSPAAYWKALGSSAKAHGLVWGGDWKRFVDVAHVQLLPNELLEKVRRGWIPPMTDP